MSREIGTQNVSTAAGEHVEPVVLMDLEFDDRVFVHSNVGHITYDGNKYIGVGTLGSINKQTESELVTPSTLSFSLSGLDANMSREAMRAGAFGDRVTIYGGYRQDDGTLVEDPYITWRGKIDSAAVDVGLESSVTFTAEHRVADINESDGARFTDEDQQAKYSGDLFFQHIEDVPTKRLMWGGREVQAGTVIPGAGGFRRQGGGGIRLL